MLCIINIFRRLRVVCLPPLTISANHEGRPARGVAKKIPIDFRNVIAKSLAVAHCLSFQQNGFASSIVVPSSDHFEIISCSVLKCV